VENAKDRAGGLDELKNRSEKCEGPGGGVDRVRTGVGNAKDWGEGGGPTIV
jgi:hypothetical protein